MVFHSKKTIALHCPACQDIQNHVFSVFTIKKQSQPLQCNCGFSHGSVRRSQDHYEFDLLTSTGEKVRLHINAREFLNAPLLVLREFSEGPVLGYVGEPEEVLATINSDEVRGLVAQANLDLTEFENPDIMYKVLHILQEMGNKDKITCECEYPSVGIDLYSDKVELICSYCGSAIVIGASTPKDGERVAMLSEIMMKQSSYMFLGEWLRPLM